MKCCTRRSDWRIWIGAAAILLFGSIDRDHTRQTKAENQAAERNPTELPAAKPDDQLNIEVSASKETPRGDRP